MKICIVNLNIYSLFNPQSLAPMGGAELDMYTLAKGLKNTHDVSVITADWGQEAMENFGGVRIIRSLKLGRSTYRSISGIFLFWKSLFQANADVYISSGAGPEVGIIAFFCKLKKRRFIYRTAHIIDCDGSYVASNGFSGMLYEYGLRNASLIVTSVKQHGRILGERYQTIKKRIFHINLGLSIDTVSGGNKDIILWVARCEKWKRPEVCLEIGSIFPGERFVMICPKQNSNPRYFDEIKKKAAFLPNVTFIDFVPFKDIQPYFDRAKIFINTSDFEGFTYTLIQSGLTRTPVVYLNVNPDEVITKYNIGYVAGGDKERMIALMRRILNDEKDWRAKSENAFSYVKQNHDIDILGEQWNVLLKSL